jgi:NAD(P)H-flavin reductase
VPTQQQSYPTGNISKYFSELNVGDQVSMKGPKGQMKYTPTYAKDIGMIAGGTGITPMLVRSLLLTLYLIPKNKLNR